MEALYPHELAVQANRTRQPPDHPGYLAQPEMRDLIAHALSLGWTLVPYEAELRNKPPGLQPISEEETSWREDQQARNLTSAFGALPENATMLVWCGYHHLAKRAVGTWRPMGSPSARAQRPGAVLDRPDTHRSVRRGAHPSRRDLG
jgi:hypothetical protein